MAICRRLLWKSLLLLILFSVVVVWGLVTFQTGRAAYRGMESMKQMQMIEMALNNYGQKYKCCPPQYLVDKHGKPAHSWRVLILPYLGCEDLYRRYRFDEPWNGPHNRLLAAEMPEEYRSLFADSKSTITPYVGIAGEATPWQGAIPLRMGDIQRPREEIIWFVDAANSDINWMEPRDIPLEQASAGINAPGGGGIQSNYSKGLPAQMLSLDRKWFPADISPDAFRAMLTITGDTDQAREKVPPSASSKRPAPDLKPKATQKHR